MNLNGLLGTLESAIVIRPTRRMTQGELETCREAGFKPPVTCTPEELLGWNYVE